MLCNATFQKYLNIQIPCKRLYFDTLQDGEYDEAAFQTRVSFCRR